MQFAKTSPRVATSRMLCSFVSAPNPTKRLETTLSFCAVVMRVSMLGRTLEVVARVLVELVAEQREVVVGKEVIESEEAIR
jgi:hypothetical protein